MYVGISQCLSTGYYLIDSIEIVTAEQDAINLDEFIFTELDGTRNARDVAQAQLATRQRELVDALETLRVSEERRIEEARRVEARAREDEIRAAASRRVGDEAARRMTEQRLVNERPKSSVAWSLFTGPTTRT